MDIKLRSRNNFRRSLLKHPTRDDIIYMAGIIDGEGSICFQKHPNARDNKVVDIGFANNSVELMEWAVDKFGYWYSEKHANKGTTAQYQWRVRRMRDVLQLCELLEPHLIIKKMKAQEVIKYLRKRLQFQ